MIKNFVIFFLLILLTGCSQGSDKVSIGFLGTLSGKYSDIGQESLKGALLAVENSGASSNIRLTVADDKGTPEAGLTAMQDFNSKNIKYVIGPNISTVAIRLIPFAKKNRMYMMSPTASSYRLSAQDNNFMRIIPPNSPAQLEAAAKYLTQQMHINNIIIIYDAGNKGYTEDVVKHFADAYMSRGGKIQDMRTFRQTKNKSMSDLISSDLKNPPQMYYIVASASDTALLLWQIKKAGIKSQILIRPWAQSERLESFSGSAADGAYIFNYNQKTDTKAYKHFQKLYVSRYKQQPTWMSLNGYEAALLMIKAMPKLNKGESFYDAISTSTDVLKDLTGLAFDDNGDANIPMSLYKIINGKTVKLETLK